MNALFNLIKTVVTITNLQNYIINVDILEEITYLWTSQGGQIHLDILPHLG